MRMNAKYLEDNGQVSSGRCRIQSVSASSSYQGTGERYYKFHNGTSSSDDVKLTVYVPTSSGGWYGSCPVSIDIPGQGILFEDGIFMSTNLDDGTDATDGLGIGMTCFYVGSVPS